MDENSKTAVIELFIRVDGSLQENRLCIFELPIVARVGSADDENTGVVQFESKELIKTIKKSLDKLI